MSKSSLYLRDLWVVVTFGLCMECGRLSVFEASLITNTTRLSVGCTFKLAKRNSFVCRQCFGRAKPNAFFFLQVKCREFEKGNFCFVLFC